MGLGDNVLATGFARGAAARGKRIAFGDGKKLIWDQHSATIFKDNKNICPPGQERASNVEWVEFYRGNRIYNKSGGDRWIWNYDFRPIPGELFFSREEERFAAQIGRRCVIIEPNVPMWKSVAPNKQWPVERYDEVAARLTKAGHQAVQLNHRGPNRLKNASLLHSPTFRCAVAMMQRSLLYIGPEGGLHHGAAAVGLPGVVLFGGFVPPQVTGYDTHTNLTGNSTEACGMFHKCDHCIAAMRSIEVEEVVEAALGHLRREAA